MKTLKGWFTAKICEGNRVEKMLEAKHGIYDGLECDLKMDGDYNIEGVFNALNLK